MRTQLALLRAYTLQTARDWPVILLSVIVPAGFFVVFSNADLPQAWSLATALVFAIVTNGLFGAPVRVVHDRQLGVLRRLRAAPVSALDVVSAVVASGIVVFAPCYVLLAIGLPLSSGSKPVTPSAALVALVVTGLLCCRSIGAAIAAATRSVQQCQLIAQTIILFLASTTVEWSPNSAVWMAVVRTLSPTHYLHGALVRVIGHGEGLRDVVGPMLALSATAAVCISVAACWFRWDMGDRPA